MKTKQAGFTLVEIAIVLVIIGLLLGGILKGQEMIIQAKVKNSLTDFSGVSAAFYGYQDRYRAIPGDDPGATRWTGAVVSTTAGDRVLTGVYSATDVATPLAATPETIIWWDHLRRSGFVTGASGGLKPVNSFNGVLGVQQGDGAGVGATPAGPILPATAGVGFVNLMLCSTNLPDKVAVALDVQMDDGNPATGSVRAVLGTDLTVTITPYAETGTNLYALCRQF
jgi:prepilin-type N-terminal cleavage/methylation domain-containing protein